MQVVQEVRAAVAKAPKDIETVRGRQRHVLATSRRSSAARRQLRPGAIAAVLAPVRRRING